MGKEGFDPTKPLYVTASNEHKLSKDDADFVDVIQTDVFGCGMLRPIGHIDFYPNIGSVQPGCESERTGSCNHDRAPRFYAESIIPTNEFWASHCGNWFSYVFNLCDLTSNDALMRYYVDESLSGIHYVKHATFRPRPYYRKVVAAAEFKFCYGDLKTKKRNGIYPLFGLEDINIPVKKIWQMDDNLL